jgi:UDP-N-acetylglucosamine 2-epimerase (non-hydrolysing)
MCVVGARPNFIKMAPLLRALEVYSCVEATLVHTGQHYDENLSEVFFTELGMKRPDVSLGIGSGKHGVQTARILERMEEALERGTPDGKRYDRMIVVGDVNSTMAATLAAAKLGLPVAHVEAGLRSFDRSMPEEINRVVTDALCDMLLVSEPAGAANLHNEGHAEEHIHLVGNVMIDTLVRLLPKAKERETLLNHKLKAGDYGVVTLHRPSNVDAEETLSGLLDVLVKTSRDIPLVFPVHPRTQARLAQFGLAQRLSQESGILQLPPLGYLDFLSLTSQTRFIVTDSGGLQEESTALGIPCLTARPNTERPITVEEGTSTLVANDPEMLERNLRAVMDGTYKRGRCPELWDGHASQRIAKILVNQGHSSSALVCECV